MDLHWWFGENSLWGQVSGDNTRDSSWWTGENSLWAQSGFKEFFTGAEGNGKGVWGNFKVPTVVDLSPDLKMGLMIVGLFIGFRILVK